MEQEETLRLARSGNSCPIGKYTAEVKTLVPEDTKDALTALAFAANKNISEYVRNIIMAHVHGQAHMLRLQHQAMNGSAGIGTE